MAAERTPPAGALRVAKSRMDSKNVSGMKPYLDELRVLPAQRRARLNDATDRKNVTT